ncbi:MAG: hypothetical protein JRM77_10265 [Nitrososphaerota archaeon]|nr:hypothetical protein [Nitrososphaerota archaeon]
MMTSSDLIGDVEHIRTKVLQWSATHLRSFPWRETRDPYRVFLAESLLKRTTSRAALRAYSPFLERYPDMCTLASSTLDGIVKCLKPVGLYRQRGVLMLEAARYVCGCLGGILPSGLEELKRIPGVGAYTAAAIASFAYGQKLPVVDSNVVRVMRRYAGDRRLTAPGVDGMLRVGLGPLCDRTFSLAMIDLGAKVCRPVRPLCGECPLASKCHGAASLLSAS